MTTPGARIDWAKTPHDLGEAVVKYGRRLNESLAEYLNRKAAELLEQMRREASWADRTGQARRELSTAVEIGGQRATLYLISGAPHGKYLELRWGGRYAIVSPTVPRAGIEIANELKREMGR